MHRPAALKTFGVLLCCLGLSFLACVARAAAQTGHPPEANTQANASLVTQARGLIEEGKLDAAIKVLLAAQIAPGDVQVNYLLGLAYYWKSDYARAIQYLSSAVPSASGESKEYRQGVRILGLSHYMLRHNAEAIPYLEQLNRWTPENIEITYALGVSYVQIREADKARATFARMFKVQPGSASAYLINAQMMMRQQMEELAEKELQKALELDPQLPQANFLLGELAIYHAQIDRGVELLQKEIAVNPAFGMAYYMLGEAYTRQLKWDEAIPPLQKSIWLNPYFSGPYIVLGKVYLKKADLPNAENMLRRAIQMDPNNYSGHHLLAQVLQQANRADEAKKEFQLAEQLRANAGENR
ncbi:MAG TPA: tetratricopeptide repeat protein [Pyrinomonadaceae bacterium]|jgi:tetratricopeptide (TPR) repeat protein|nr:tetratricopeptide repeat protein [Pyrinomonadaceae bacterium]